MKMKYTGAAKFKDNSDLLCAEGNSHILREA